MQPWKRIEPTIVTKIDRREIVLKTFMSPEGHTGTFATFLGEGTRSGAIVALTPDKKVIVAKQFRPGPEKIMYEIPGGGIEPGEDPQAGVMRELREETGYLSDSVTFLGTTCRDAYTNGMWYYYLALNCTLHSGGQDLDEHEYVDVELVSIPDFIENAKNDLMTDPAAVLFAYDRLKELADA